MPQPASSSPSSPMAVFGQESTRAERVIARVRLALAALMTIADVALVAGLVSGARPVPVEVLAIDLPFLAFAGLTVLWLRHREASEPVRLALITIDYAVSAVYVWQLHALMGLDADLTTTAGTAAWVLLILISALRFSMVATLYSGALSAGLCLAFGVAMGALSDTILFAVMLPLVAAAAAAYLSWRHRQAVDLIVQRARFQRFLPRGVVDTIIDGDEEPHLGGQKVWATVLFTDIRDFTTMSEALDPLEVVAFLNEYLSEVVDVVFEHLGTVDKFIGDAVMAVFGAPFVREDDPLRAVRCALAIRRATARLNATRAAEGRPPIEAGVGVHTGWVVAGTIGAEERMDYTVVGDTVNVAARLQGLTRQLAADILLSRATADAIGDAVALESKGEVAVKGRAHPIEVFALGHAQGGES